jgi:hypothetical protein
MRSYWAIGTISDKQYVNENINPIDYECQALIIPNGLYKFRNYNMNCDHNKPPGL